MQTPVGWIPEDWEVIPLGNLCKIEYGASHNGVISENGSYLIWGTGGIIGKTNKFIYDKPSIILGRKGTINKPFLVEEPFWAIDTTFYLIVNVNININWLYQYLSYIKLERMNEASGVPSLSRTNLYKMLVRKPSIIEQIKISSLLLTWDKAIEIIQKLIAAKEQLKKGLMQQLLTGKKRLPGFEGEWKYNFLKPFIKEVTTRKKKSAINEVLSVTNRKGFIKQIEHFDKQLASKDLSNYKIIKRGQFAYNPSRINVGSIDILNNLESGIISPMYVVFETKPKKLMSEYLLYQLKSHWFAGHIPMYVQGSVRNTLSFNALCCMKFFIPDLKEQIGISNILLTIDKEIKLLKTQLELYREQKKGLMQVLLTGAVRVKV